MWRVNKRYLYDDMFVTQSQGTSSFNPTSTDEFILQDKSLDYRVLNFAGSTFNENNTSYHHKSIGGYHAAKLQRYQDMIDCHISGEMRALYNDIIVNNGVMDSIDGGRYRVLNMLNTKYVIFPAGRNGETIPLENPFAYGNAWFVGNVKYVDNANDEIKYVGEVDTRATAVVDKRFSSIIGEKPKCGVEGSSIKLTDYAPNHLVYEADAETDGVVVFSEIYYPGWEVTVDGKSVELARADYILRALPLAAGHHKIEMSFEPKSIVVTDGIAYAAYVALIIGAVVLIVRARKK
jgi:hypothetical protein